MAHFTGGVLIDTDQHVILIENVASLNSVNPHTTYHYDIERDTIIPTGWEATEIDP